MSYKDFAHNIYSENGEDGIIQQLFKDLNITRGIVVEFGAWDGFYCSNTANLWYNRGFFALLMENHKENVRRCKEAARRHSVQVWDGTVDKLNHEENSLAKLIDDSKFHFNEDNFALLSIDIDSYDYELWEDYKGVRPKVVIIEVSSGYRPDVEYVDRNGKNGCSLLSLMKLADRKGYRCVCHVGNAILVRDDLVDQLPKYDWSPEALWSSPQEMKDRLATLKRPYR